MDWAWRAAHLPAVVTPQGYSRLRLQGPGTLAAQPGSIAVCCCCCCCTSSASLAADTCDVSHCSCTISLQHWHGRSGLPQHVQAVIAAGWQKQFAGDSSPCSGASQYWQAPQLTLCRIPSTRKMQHVSPATSTVHGLQLIHWPTGYCIRCPKCIRQTVDLHIYILSSRPAY